MDIGFIANGKPFETVEEQVYGEIILSILNSKISGLPPGPLGEIYAHFTEKERLMKFGLLDYFNNFNVFFPEQPQRSIYSMIQKELPESATARIMNRLETLVDEMGYSRKDIAEWHKILGAGPDMPKRVEFVCYVLPLYIQLRKEGFTPNELSGTGE